MCLFGSLRNTPIICSQNSVRRMDRAEETEHRRKRTGLIISLPSHYISLHLKSAICPLYIIPSAVPLLLLRFTSLCPTSAICPLYIIPSTVPLFLPHCISLWSNLPSAPIDTLLAVPLFPSRSTPVSADHSYRTDRENEKKNKTYE